MSRIRSSRSCSGRREGGPRPDRRSSALPVARERVACACLLLAGIAFTGAGHALADTPSARLEAAVEKAVAPITEIRHQIHQHPELGNREFATAKLIAGFLTDLGMEVQTGVAHTGVVGILHGDRPGPLVAVRADMDALPVTEETPYPWKSTVRTEYLGQEVGVMHACGHDVHTAVQLGVASALAAVKSDLPGSVQFIFQPAEEGPPPGEEGGAELMLKEGLWEKTRPAAVFGLHTFAQMAVGDVGFTVGPAFAAVDHFRIELHGKQAHGAQPQRSIDPVVMASQAVMALQTIRSRNLHPLQPSVVTVGIIRGGERFNIIPNDVHLEGTVRTYDADVRDTVERRMREILEGVTHAAGGSFDLDYERGSPATINDAALARAVVPTLQRIMGADHVLEIDPTMGGEDFAFFANEVPGFYFRLGTVNAANGSGGHHTPDFMADDASVPIGIRVMSNVLMNYLKAHAN